MSNSSEHEPVQDVPGSSVPPIEDASEPDEPAAEPVSDDAPEELLLDTTARSLNGDGAAVLEPTTEPAPTPAPPGEGDAIDIRGDAVEATYDVITGEATVPSRRKGDWECELSAHNVAVELKHIEAEVRAILEDRDPRRKRKLSGTSRWLELEDDLLALRYTGRIDEDSLRRLRELIARRHYLFRHLRFLASTRPTWNT